MINLELYRIFQMVARSGSFSAAAKELFISQSAVSQSIKQLEAQAGCLLFIRGSRGVTLTREGEMLYEYVNSALILLNSGEENLRKMHQLEAGSLKIGAGDTISESFLLPLLEQFHNTYPKISIEVINRTSSQAVALLKKGGIDLAFVNLPLPPEEEESLLIREVLTVQDIFVGGEKFRNLAGRKISFRELSGYPLIMLENLSASRRYVNQIAEQNGVRLQPDIELGAHRLLLEFAKIGLGLSCVIQEFSKEALAEGKIFPIHLEPEIPPRSIGFCRLEKVSPSFASQEFMKLCEG